MKRIARPSAAAVLIASCFCSWHATACSGRPSRVRTAGESVEGHRFRQCSIARTAPGATATDGQFGGALPLNNPAYLAIVDDASMRDAIANGIAGTSMPAFAINPAAACCTDDQVTAIVNGIRSRWGGSAKSVAGTPRVSLRKRRATRHQARSFLAYIAPHAMVMMAPVGRQARSLTRLFSHFTTINLYAP